MLTSSPWTALLLSLSLLVVVPTAGAAASYTVQKGDSLSSIAARQLGNADRWREIWSLNPQLRTPEQLQAGTRLQLPAAASPQQRPSTEADSSPNVPDPAQVLAQELIRSGQVDRMRTDYRLLDRDAAEYRIRIHASRTETDGVYLYIHGLSGSSTEGELFGLFRPSLEPAGESFVELMRVGKARLALRQQGKARLQVTESSQEQLQGLRVLPMNRNLPEIQARHPSAPINGRIIKALYEQPGGYLLLLDQGSRAGVQPGHLLQYSKVRPAAAGSAGDIQGSLEDGWMLVIDTSHDASLALVIQARRIPAVGDSVH